MEYENTKDLEYELLEKESLAVEETREDEEASMVKAIIDSIRVGASITMAVAVNGSNIYFGCNDGYLYALKNNGKLNWKFRTGGPIFSPAVGDGVVYFGSFDSYLYAVDEKDGNLLWRFKTRDKIASQPALRDGRIYISSLDGCVYALSTSGDMIWSYQTNGIVFDTPTIVNDRLFFGSADKNFYCLSKDGDLMWSFPTYGFLSTHAIVDNKGNEVWKLGQINKDIQIRSGAVCFGSNDGFIYLVDIDGNLLWKAKTEKKITRVSISGDTVFGGCHSNEFYALSLKDGTMKWKFPTNGPSVGSKPAIKDGIVYFGCTDNNLYALNAETGSPLWKFRTNGVITAPPVIDGDILYVGSWDGYMYAIDIKKQEVVWKFQTGFAPTKPIFLSTLSKLASLKNRIHGLWRPEPKPKGSIYDKEQNKSQFFDMSGSYKITNRYETKPTYSMDNQYSMQREKRQDKRRPFDK